jgi:hypothetical protein
VPEPLDEPEVFTRLRWKCRIRSPSALSAEVVEIPTVGSVAISCRAPASSGLCVEFTTVSTTTTKASSRRMPTAITWGPENTPDALGAFPSASDWMTTRLVPSGSRD